MEGEISPAVCTMIAELVEVTSPVTSYATEPPCAGLMAIGTHVTGPHGAGVIVGYNDSASMFYGAARYPYVVKFDDGFQEIYNSNEILPV